MPWSGQLEKIILTRSGSSRQDLIDQFPVDRESGDRYRLDTSPNKSVLNVSIFYFYFSLSNPKVDYSLAIKGETNGN